MFDLADLSNRHQQTSFYYTTELKTADDSKQQAWAATSGRFSPLTAPCSAVLFFPTPAQRSAYLTFWPAWFRFPLGSCSGVTVLITARIRNSAVADRRG